MAILVHTISGAPRGWRVLAGLALKNLEWENHFLNFGEKEHLQPEFLAINPRGTVPVLEDDGIAISDSLGILAWLDRKYPEHPLFGTSVEEAAQIWQQTTDINDYMRAACDALLSKIFPNDDVVPSPKSDLWRAMQNGAELMHTECARHDDTLKNFAYLAGENQSAADAVALPEFSLLKRAIDTKPVLMEALGFKDMASKYPNLWAWLSSLQALPKIQQNMPPHWNL